jgi:hypothetical protein
VVASAISVFSPEKPMILLFRWGWWFFTGFSGGGLFHHAFGFFYLLYRFALISFCSRWWLWLSIMGSVLGFGYSDLWLESIWRWLGFSLSSSFVVLLFRCR